MAIGIYQQVDSNIRRTYLIMAVFVLFVVGVTYVFARSYGYGLGVTGIALILAGVVNFLAYYNSDKIVIATAGAKEATKEAYPDYVRAVENMSIAAGLSLPKIYVIPDASPNAFATGRDPQHASVVATTGLLEKMDRLELEGVIAHEMSHVGNYDTRPMSIVVILVGTVALLANFFLRSRFYGDDNNSRASGIFLLIGLVLAILSPIAATLLQLAISRRREFLADASGALLTRYPKGLADALEIIGKDPRPLKNANTATAHLFIADPLRKKSFLTGLFNTHPPIEERIKVLRAMVV